MTKQHHTGMALIAGFKVAKGVLLLLVGLGLLKLVHAEIATLFSQLLEALHLNADSRILHNLILKVDALQPHSVLVISLVSMAYAALLLTEGVGLWFEFSWAAYLTVISTSLFPFGFTPPLLFRCFQAPLPHGQDLSFYRFLLGRVGDEQPPGGLFLGLRRFDQYPIL